MITGCHCQTAMHGLIFCHLVASWNQPSSRRREIILKRRREFGRGGRSHLEEDPKQSLRDLSGRVGWNVDVDGCFLQLWCSFASHHRHREGNKAADGPAGLLHQLGHCLHIYVRVCKFKLQDRSDPNKRRSNNAASDEHKKGTRWRRERNQTGRSRLTRPPVQMQCSKRGSALLLVSTRKCWHWHLLERGSPSVQVQRTR